VIGVGVLGRGGESPSSTSSPWSAPACSAAAAIAELEVLALVDAGEHGGGGAESAMFTLPRGPGRAEVAQHAGYAFEDGDSLDDVVSLDDDALEDDVYLAPGPPLDGTPLDGDGDGDGDEDEDEDAASIVPHPGRTSRTPP
jgi:hypothetical protein